MAICRYSHLVGGIPTPLKNVSSSDGKDDIPYIMEKMFQTTNQLYQMVNISHCFSSLNILFPKLRLVMTGNLSKKNMTLQRLFFHMSKHKHGNRATKGPPFNQPKGRWRPSLVPLHCCRADAWPSGVNSSHPRLTGDV